MPLGCSEFACCSLFVVIARFMLNRRWRQPAGSHRSDCNMGATLVNFNDFVTLVVPTNLKLRRLTPNELKLDFQLHYLNFKPQTT